MTTKSTKRSLILSALAMLICFTMLIGTTYAWFTDSVTSAGNIIKTGTLEVSLDWAEGTKDPNATDTTWNDASAGAIFNYDKCEPGYVAARHMKITNDGSLSLKYTLSIVPMGNVGDLANVIDVYFVDGGQQITDRANLGTLVGTLADIVEDGIASGTLESEASRTITIVLKMQETAGNEYQDLDIAGGFAVQLLATQATVEDDDIGTGYDDEATYPTVNKVEISAGTTEPTSIPAGNATVKIPAGAPEGEYEFAISNEKVETDDQGNTTASFDLELKVDGQKATGSYPVEKFIGKNLNLTGITHNGEAIAIDNYDPTTGIVTFTANGFSPFTVTYYSGEIKNVEDIANIAKGGNFVLINNIDLAGTTLVIPADKAVNLDLNGKTITGTKGRDADNNRIHVIVNNGILTIKDGTVKSAGNDGGSAIYNEAGATLTIEDVTLYGAPQSDPVYEAGVSKPFPSYAVNNYGNAVVNGATVKSYHGAIATGGEGVTVIDDADIDVGLGQSTGITSYVIYSYENAQVTVNDGKFAFTKQEIYVNGGNTFCELGTNPIIINGGNYIGTSFSTGAGREYVINGGTFDKDPSAYVAEGCVAMDNNDGTYSVYANASDSTMTLKDGSVLDLGGVEFLGTVVAEGDLTIKGDTKIKTLSATNGGTITIEDGKTLTLNNFSFGAKSTAGSKYTITGGTITAGYGFFQHGTYALYSNFETGYMYYSYGSDITVYGTFHSQGKGDGLDYVRGKLTIAAGGKSIHDKSLWVGQPANWGAMSATLIVEEGGYVQANSISVYDGSVAYNSAANIGVENVGVKYNSLSGKIDVVCSNTDQLVDAINSGATTVCLASGEYALRFTNNTNFNLDNMTIKGMGEVKLSITSTEGWYGRVQGSNVTFENIHFTSAVGATGMATYNNCTFDSWTICASSNNEETYFNDCTINGCLNTSTDFSSGDVFVKNCKIAKAEYSGSMTVNFTECEIGEVIIWNANTNFTKCDVTTMNLDNVTTATITVDGVAK